MRVRRTAAAAGVVGLAVTAEVLLRRRRPRTAHGRYADWVHPGSPAAGPLQALADSPTAGPLQALADSLAARPLQALADSLAARPLQALANSRAARAAAEALPVPPMVSDITDVVYVNYLVPAARLLPLVPEGLRLQRIGPDGEQAVFTFLTYRHGHLGPPILGRLRRILPSPVQTNWRIYVHDPHTGHDGVHFVTTAVDRAAHALGGRLFCEALPMHLLRRAAVERADEATVRLRLDPGIGSAPDADAVLTFAPEPAGGPWRSAFGTYQDMLRYVVHQDRALSVQPWHRRITRQEIRLGLTPADCHPLAGSVRSRSARAIVGDAEPFSFHVPRVTLRFDSEEYHVLRP